MCGDEHYSDYISPVQVEDILNLSTLGFRCGGATIQNGSKLSSCFPCQTSRRPVHLDSYSL